MQPIGVMLVGALFYELVARRKLHWATHVAIAAVLLWSGWYGAVGRERAYVGALFAFWPAIIVPGLALVYPALAQRHRVVV